jgi:ferric-dicitrate binding protein FerR (iron transport regulator)
MKDCILDDHILHIVTRILANEANAKDILAFNDWMSRDEKNRHKCEQLMDYWNMSVGIENAETPEASFDMGSRGSISNPLFIT